MNVMSFINIESYNQLREPLVTQQQVEPRKMTLARLEELLYGDY